MALPSDPLTIITSPALTAASTAASIEAESSPQMPLQSAGSASMSPRIRALKAVDTALKLVAHPPPLFKRLFERFYDAAHGT